MIIIGLTIINLKYAILICHGLGVKATKLELYTNEQFEREIYKIFITSLIIIIVNLCLYLYLIILFIFFFIAFIATISAKILPTTFYLNYIFTFPQRLHSASWLFGSYCTNKISPIPLSSKYPSHRQYLFYCTSWLVSSVSSSESQLSGSFFFLVGVIS